MRCGTQKSSEIFAQGFRTPLRQAITWVTRIAVSLKFIPTLIYLFIQFNHNMKWEVAIQAWRVKPCLIILIIIRTSVMQVVHIVGAHNNAVLCASP